MHIGIDASRTTVARITGTERYALEMIRGIIRLNETRPNPHAITLYFRDEPTTNLFPASEYVTHRVISMPRLWTHTAFALALLRDRPDVVWVPAHTLPFVFPGKAVVTIHDIGYRVYPKAHPLRQRIPLDVYTRWSAQRATLVLADSKATARDLRRYYGTPSDKVKVVYPGVTPPPITGSLDQIRAKYGIPERYWLYLGTLQPRKNIPNIVGAFHQWQAANPNVDAALVLAGGKGWQFDERWVMGDRVILTGYIDEVDKGALLKGAFGLVFPSLYEGFGFPIVEAMAVGTPVICSDTSSLPELGGDAVLYAKPNHVLMISDQMSVLTEDTGVRERLIEAGYVQAARFTWERAAHEALAALEGVGSG